MELTRNQKKVIELVESYSSRTLLQLTKSRKNEVLKWRNILCYCLYKYAGLSYVKIGRLINRHHASIINAVRVCGLDIEQQGEYYAKDYNEITLRAEVICNEDSARAKGIKMNEQGSSIMSIVGAITAG